MAAPRRSTRRPSSLHETAKLLYIAPDADIAGTRYPALRRLTDAEGVTLDPWQEGAAKLILSVNTAGRFAFGVGGVGMSLPRQVGKTWLMTRIVFALACAVPDSTIIWTAHHTRTSDETFDHMRTMSLRSPYKRYVSGVRAANGQQTVNFGNGSRILFGSRERGFGRGMDGVDALILDEAQILKSTTLSDMLPTMNASPDPLYVMLGTPPRPLDPSEAFRSRRKEAWEGKGRGCMWLEFGADTTDDIASHKTWRKANPTLGRRTRLDAIERLTELPPDDFRREALGVWDESGGGPELAIPDETWNKLEIGAVPDANPDKTAVAVDMTPDRRLLVIGRARHYPDPDSWIIDLPAVGDVIKDGTQWAVDWVRDHWPDLNACVIDAKSPAMTLAPDFKAAHVKLTVTRTDAMGAATGRLLDAARNGTLRHPPEQLQPLLRQAQQNAVLRPLGRSGLTALTGKGAGEPVAPLVACSLAIQGAVTSHRRPHRKQTLR